MKPETEQALTFRWSDLPTVTPEAAGIGGSIRLTPEDFAVVEQPLYLPSGRGSHAYFRIEKINLSTRDVQRALIAAGIPANNIGLAGLKDKVARTEQWLSVPRAHQALAATTLAATDGVRILEESRHSNKLGIGHLLGNTFEIRIRGVAPHAVKAAQATLDALVERGLPNYFGPQRFGRGGRNAIDGWRLLQGEHVPGDIRLKRFFLSALQSQIFNLLLAARIHDGLFQGLVDGDWARKHDTGGTFEVASAALEVSRAVAGDISATLPLHGKKVKMSSAAAGEREQRILDQLDVRWPQLAARHGDRRLSRIFVRDAHVGTADDGVKLTFSLPKGSYATVLLREVMKIDVDAPIDGGSDASS